MIAPSGPLLCAGPCCGTCRQFQWRIVMTEIEMKTEVDVEEFTDELSDVALDRAEAAYCLTVVASS